MGTFTIKELADVETEFEATVLREGILWVGQRVPTAQEQHTLHNRLHHELAVLCRNAGLTNRVNAHVQLSFAGHRAEVKVGWVVA